MSLYLSAALWDLLIAGGMAAFLGGLHWLEGRNPDLLLRFAQALCIVGVLLLLFLLGLLVTLSLSAPI